MSSSTDPNQSINISSESTDSNSGRSTRRRGPPPLEVPHVAATRKKVKKPSGPDNLDVSVTAPAAVSAAGSAAVPAAALAATVPAAVPAAVSAASAAGADYQLPGTSFFRNTLAFLGGRPPAASSDSNEPTFQDPPYPSDDEVADDAFEAPEVDADLSITNSNVTEHVVKHEAADDNAASDSADEFASDGAPSAYGADHPADDPADDPSDDGDSSGDPDDPGYHPDSNDDNDPPEDSSDSDSSSTSMTAPTPGTILQAGLNKIEYFSNRLAKVLAEHDSGAHPLSLLDANAQLNAVTSLDDDIRALQEKCFDTGMFSHVKDATTGIAPVQEALVKIEPYETTFNQLRTRVNTIVKDLTPQLGQGLKPPKVGLPSFKGDAESWPVFKAAFKDLVIKSTKFSDCEKMRLLKDAVKGDAEDTISDLQPTDANWTLAWSRMTQRYDSPSTAAHAAIRPLLDITANMTLSALGIHKLMNTLRTTQAQIQLIQLGPVSELELIYSHHLFKGMDTKTMKEFLETLPDNNLPRLTAILTWLEKRARAMDVTSNMNHRKHGDADGYQPILAVGERKVSFATKTQDRGRSRSPAPAGRSASHKQRREVVQQIKKPRAPSPARPKNNAPQRPPGPARPVRPRSKSPTARPLTTPDCYVCASKLHRTNQCPEFEFTVNARRDWVRSHDRCYNCLGNHSVRDCTSRFTCSQCHKKHHSHLHVNDAVSPIMTLFTTHPAPVFTDNDGIGILPTAMVTVTNAHHGQMDQARCLLDSGAERCFITSAAVKRLGLVIKGRPQHFVVAGGRTTPSLGSVTLHIRNRSIPEAEATFEVLASVLPQITCSIPGQPFDTWDTWEWDHIEQLPLADPTFNVPGPIDVLLGTGFIDRIMRGKKIEGPRGFPSAYLTEFGYVLQGRLEQSPCYNIVPARTVDTCPAHDVDTAEIQPPMFQMQKFWEIEEMPFRPVLTPEEQECEDHFTEHMIRLPDGRFQVKWPFIMSPKLLGTSYYAALNRWLAMEKKLQANPTLHADYHGQLEDYLKHGQLELIPKADISISPHYWIPHHAVFKPSSTTTKMRIVFDASAKTTSGKSVNALLAPGPTIQPPLFTQLINFRLKSVAMTADIARMYRQIYVDPSERDFARIIWRKDPKDPIQHYRHISIPFGFASSPFLATRCLQQLASDGADQYPLAAEALCGSFYVDDFLFSEESTDKAIRFKDELLALLGTAHMELRKWSSNSAELLATIPDDLRETQLPLDISNGSTIGTLGMSWNPATDAFQFNVTLTARDHHTKRTVLSDISKVFDPLGLLAPTIILAKMLMQRVWTQEIDWDESLPEALLEQWLTFYKDLPDLEQIKIPRWLGYSSTNHVELHGFCDASEKAFGAAIYLRTRVDDTFTCHLIASKSRVAPVKTTTIPRLELQGAVLLAELMHLVRQQYRIEQHNVFYWTDSTICLHWIFSHPSKWKIYVANRVQQIQEHSIPTQWNHVISEDNPADCSSRGLTPAELRDSQLWWNGPEWLQRDFTPPVFTPTACGDELITREVKPILTAIPMEDHFLIRSLSRISSWTKALRVTAILLSIAKNRSLRGVYAGPCAPVSLATAELKLVQLLQAIGFPALREALKDGFRDIKFKQYRNLKSLNLFMQDGVFRVGGRLQNSALLHETKHPALLPVGHPLVRAMILNCHQALAHAGRLAVHNHLRQKYWIPSATKTIKSVIDKCLLCFRYHAQATPQLMGQLPSARVNATRPFQHTGVDFFGPYELRPFTGRSGKFKVWVALFTCMATRALHLEIVSSLSQYGFLLAFRRFIARRGKPTHMYSDNGTNFVGAHRYLTDVRNRALVTKGLTRAILPDLDIDQIVWRFNPPSAPSQGGVWESCVRLVKTHLKKLTADDSHTWEQFESILTFIEAILNSRPLTPLSDDPQDLEALTPAHFLVGVSHTLTPEDDLTHLRINQLDRYQLVIRRQQELWQRWQEEYITSLQKRPKWQKEMPNLKPDEMVLIIDDQSSPLHWRVGRVKSVHPGEDGLVRVTTVETESTYKDDKGTLIKQSKEFVRPITKLARIPIELDEQDPRFKALPYPNIYPAVTTIVRSQQLFPVASWKWIFTIMSLAAAQLPALGAATVNVSHLADSTTQSLRPALVPDSWITTVVICCLVIFATIGILGNCCTILAILHDTKLRRNHIHWFILSLCCSDLLFSSTSIPMAVSRLYYRRWMLPEIFCHASAFLLFGNIICTLSHIVTITMNRYVRIVHHQWYHRIYTDTSVRCLLTCCWTLSFGALLPPLLRIRGQFGRKHTDSSSCTILPDDSGYNPKPVLWIIGNLVPVTIILFCYLHILIYVYTVRSRVRKLSDDSPGSGVIGAPQRPHDAHLSRMVCFIVGGYLLAFEPVLILNWFDSSRTKISASVHLLSAMMAWSTAWLNLAIYISTNRDYRKAYISLFSRGGRSTVRPTRRTARPRIPRIAIQMFLLGCIGTVIAVHEPLPDLSKKAPPCADPWESHHVVPPCISTVQWLHIQPNGTVCSRRATCSDHYMISSDTKSCIETPPSCKVRHQMTLDNIQCQTMEDDTHADFLQIPPMQSNLCSVSGLTLRDCPRFTESYDDVPVVLLGTKAYPLESLQTAQHAITTALTSYNCVGNCKDKDCSKGHCSGDPLFCSNFLCPDGNHINTRSTLLGCDCTFNSSSIAHTVSTGHGLVIPKCWGSLRVPVRKEIRKIDSDEFACVNCRIECTSTGLRIYTPGRVGRYIKVLKNPGHVSVIPTSTTTDIQLTNNMLVASGEITIQLWFDDYDIPSIRELSCPRSPVCSLIRCRICVERWMNVSCYDTYHWIVMSTLGLTITGLLLSGLYLIRTVMNLSWYLCWPLRCIYGAIRRRRTNKVNQLPIVTPVQDVEGLPLLDMPPNPYATLSRTNRRPRRQSFLISLCLILTVITTSQACSNFAMMSAATTQCLYNHENQRTCDVRINTRLAISPVGQESCLRIDDSRTELLGTITLKTKSISLRCEKQIMYYVPRPSVKCDSSRQCFNILSGHECTYNSCVDFGPNSTIKAFGHTMNNLGWSICDSVLPGCIWPNTHDCHFVRTSIINPTGQAYTVYNCPEWTYAVELEVQLHLGNNITKNNVVLFAGKKVTLNNIELSLISATIPPIPTLSECVLTDNFKFGMAPCNKRGEVTANRLGEIQCNSITEAQTVSNKCLGSFNLINTHIDDDGVKCESDLVDPELLLKRNSLPLKLFSGALIPYKDSVSYEASGSSILEIQVDTNKLTITKEVENVECDVQFIKIAGFYSCLSGSVLFLQGQTDGDPTTASIECPKLGFFTLLHLTSQLVTTQIIMKVDQPDIDTQCTVRCTTKKFPINIKGHLQYIPNSDVRELKSVIIHEPELDILAGFSISSLLGSDIMDWVHRGVVIIIIIILAYIVVTISMRIILKKLV